MMVSSGPALGGCKGAGGPARAVLRASISPPVGCGGLLGAMAADRVAHEQTLERIRRSHKLGLVVAGRIARGQPVYRGLARGAVRRALEALRDAGIIESHGRADWRLSNPLLKGVSSG